MKTAIAILALTVLAHTHSWSQAVAPQEAELSKLVFYRRASFFRGHLELWAKDEAVAKGFQGNTYFELEVPSGELQLLTTGRPAWAISSRRFRMQVEAGKTYYIEVALDYDFIATTFYLVQRTEEEFLNRKHKMKRDEQAKRKLD